MTKEEAKIRLDLILQLMGRGDDFPLSLHNELVAYRETLKLVIQPIEDFETGAENK